MNDQVPQVSASGFRHSNKGIKNKYTKNPGIFKAKNCSKEGGKGKNLENESKGKDLDEQRKNN